MKVVVIGGGPAGMMAAITSAENGNEVILLEKNKGLGKKLLITGKGRCNITSSLPMEDFIKNTPGNGMFLYSAYNKFTNQDIISFLKKQGLDVKEERGNRIFPVTDKSQDVLNCFEKKLKSLKNMVITEALQLGGHHVSFREDFEPEMPETESATDMESEIPEVLEVPEIAEEASALGEAADPGSGLR